ncbi:MAG: tRNA 4-thiouridine(8) synthase ThiI [Candidatus Pacebacteria bacterium]|nr:tRNA 4-thiouridine(8) synthase ThiI [Candidatus Paceibacterota bacterium]
MKRGLIIAFGELFLKSEGVKRIFKKKLENNIFFVLKKEKISFKLISLRERIFIETEDVKKAKKALKRVFGISWISESFYSHKIDLENLFSFISQNYINWIKEKETFAVRVRIEEKIIKESKKELIEKAAKIIDRKVKLKKPGKEINIEIRKHGQFLYFKKEKGAGGLPYSSSGRVLILMSGGIDSPVASHLISKRGGECVWVHFHSFPLTSNKSIEKIKELAKVFSKTYPKLRVYFVPFHKIQMEIKSKSSPFLRVLLYRRKMIQIAGKIAMKEKCEALATGESLGQVSSQTLSNIAITSEISKLPILRPLISSDKEEIIETAKEIGVFDISIKPQEDCCTLFVPKKSTGKGSLEKIKEIEKILDNKITRKEEKEAFFIDFC